MLKNELNYLDLKELKKLKKDITFKINQKEKEKELSNAKFDFINNSVFVNDNLFKYKISQSGFLRNKDNVVENLAKNTCYNYMEALYSALKHYKKIYYDMQNKYYNEKENFFNEEIKLIEKDLDFLISENKENETKDNNYLENYNEIKQELVFNLIKSYSQTYINELVDLINKIKEISMIDCDECGSTMEYLESRKAYCCGNEDCFNEII